VSTPASAAARAESASSRLEGVALVAILLTVAGFAGAASFTHVKDWTLANSPPGTGEWFGWANAVISELLPAAAALDIRRRRRTGQPIGYPMTVLAAAVALSLAAQLAVAKPGPSGWLLSAVPALAFLALTKLVLTGRPTDAMTTPPDRDPEPALTVPSTPHSVTVTAPPAVRLNGATVLRSPVVPS
jgi:hypothetical protein